MSRPIALGVALVLASAGGVGGCAGGGQQPATAPRTGAKVAAVKPKEAFVALEGRVLATADLISDKGGGVLSNNGAGIVSNNGGALVGKTKLRLAQAASTWLAVEQAEVELVGVDERPVPGVAPARSDGTGRYRLLAPRGSWIVRVKANGARLSAFARVGAGRVEADVSPATTVVAEFARARAAEARTGLEQVAEAAIAALVARVEPLLAAGGIALDLTSPAAAVQVLERAAAAEGQVRRDADALVASIAAPSASPTASAAPSTAPTPTPTPDPLLGTIIAGQAQLDPKPAAAADAADAVGVDIGVPDSLAVTADGTVFFTSPAGTLRAITPAGAYIAAPLDAPIGSRLASSKGEALFVDATRTKIMAAASGAASLEPRQLVAVQGAPLPAGAPIAAAPGGGFLVGHTSVGLDGVQADFLATSATLASRPEPKAGALPVDLAYGDGGRLFVSYRPSSGGTIAFELQPGGQVLRSFGTPIPWAIATDGLGRMVVSQGGRVSRRDGTGAEVDLARGLACGPIAFAPDGTLYYVDVGAIRRLAP